MDGFDGLPVCIGWELTLACNLRCRHCASAAALARIEELTTGEALTLCDQFPELLVHEVNFTGGEPLLRRDWPVIAERLRRLGIRTQLITNGLALEADTLRQMRDVGMDSLGTSLDGLERTHDRLRARPGLFRRVVAGLQLALEAGLTPTVITTVNALNLHELPAMLELLRSVGVPRWQVQPLFPLGRGHSDGSLHLDQSAYLAFGEFARRQAQESPDGEPTIILPDGYGYGTDLDPRADPWAGCPAGLLSCGITSDGKVKGCLSLPDELVEGDLRQQSLWDIWFNPDSFALTRRFSLEALGPNCAGCERGDTCQGGCSVMSYSTTGRFHNDPCCFLGIARRAC